MIRKFLTRSLARLIGVAAAIPAVLVLSIGLYFLIRHTERMAFDNLPKAFDTLHEGALLGALIVGLTVVAAVAASLRQFLVKPLHRLTAIMKRAEAGEFLVRAKVESDDEIGQLARSFNTMLARVTDMQVERLQSEEAVTAMENELRVKKELEVRLRDLTLLHDVTHTLSSTLELASLLNLLTQNVGETLGLSEFAVLLRDEAQQDLVVAAVYGFKDAEVKGTRFALGEGITGAAAKGAAPILVPDVSREPRFLRYKGHGGASGSFLAIPMRYKDQLVGVLNFARGQVDAFAAQEIVLLQSIAGQAAMAIVNARLFEKTALLSVTDPLTGVYNRRHLFARLDLEVTRASRFGTQVAVIMIDVDHFKQYNDKNGHAQGDEVLRRVASMLEKNVRKVDCVARYGGEEFVLVLPRQTRVQGAEVAEKLRKLIALEAFPYGEQQPLGKVTASFGVAAYPEDGRDMDEVVDHSDAALFAAKRAGRDHVMPYAPGQELHPDRERGPLAEQRRQEKHTAA